MGAGRQQGIPGYGYGTQETARSPVTLEDLDLLKQTVLYTEEDERHLRMAGDVLEGQTDDILDLWYGFVGDHPHLIYYFADARTTRSGSTTTTRSHSVTPAPRRTRTTGLTIRRTTSRCATSSPSSTRSRQP